MGWWHKAFVTNWRGIIAMRWYLRNGDASRNWQRSEIRGWMIIVSQNTGNPWASSWICCLSFRFLRNIVSFHRRTTMQWGTRARKIRFRFRFWVIGAGDTLGYYWFAFKYARYVFPIIIWIGLQTMRCNVSYTIWCACKRSSPRGLDSSMAWPSWTSC